MQDILFIDIIFVAIGEMLTMTIRTILLVILAAVSGLSAAVGVKRFREQPAAPNDRDRSYFGGC